MNKPRVLGQLFMAVKDGIIMEQNLTSNQAALYRGTDIRTIPQRGIASLNLYRSLEHTIKFRPKSKRRAA